MNIEGGRSQPYADTHDIYTAIHQHTQKSIDGTNRGEATARGVRTRFPDGVQVISHRMGAETCIFSHYYTAFVELPRMRKFEMMVNTAERNTELSPEEQEGLITSTSNLKPLFPR